MNPKSSLGAVATILVLGFCLGTGPAWAQYGRTYGGYGGGYLGAVAGTSVGTALVTAAGIANPLLGGAIVTTTALGSGLAGARLGSSVGDGVDHRFGPEKIWGMVGGVTGALAGFALMPGGHIVGKLLGAGIGAVAGAWLGDHFAKKADRDFNARSAGALIGGVNGALMGGPVGAALGVPLGYIGGDLLDRHVFGDRKGLRAPWFRPSDLTPRRGFHPGDYDREAYDRLGYDRDGYDREGYDRFGYDRKGFDRQGFDGRGFKETRIGDPPWYGRPWEKGSSPDHGPWYDPVIYDEYWKTYSQFGGETPKLDETHWEKFPGETASAARDRYAQTATQPWDVTSESTATSPTGGDSLEQVKARHEEALAKVQRLSKDATTSPDALRAAHRELEEAEKALAAKMMGQ